MQTIISIFENNLTEDPIINAILIGIMFCIFRDFYIMLFSAMFEPFKRK